jgi:hypothetical protein
MNEQPAPEISDREVFYRAIRALEDLRRTTKGHAKYGAYRVAAEVWVNKAADRLAAGDS